MIARYTRPEMGAIWTDQKKYECWLEVELAASQSLAELGEVPEDAAAALRSNAGFDLCRIQEIEREVRHDVIAFTTAVAETMKAKGAGDLKVAAGEKISFKYRLYLHAGDEKEAKVSEAYDRYVKESKR